MPTETIRIDKLLFFIRLARSRSLAAAWADAGHIRINGRRVERASAPSKTGDVITLPRGEDVVVAIRLLSLPARRGPASEAHACYEVLP